MAHVSEALSSAASACRRLSGGLRLLPGPGPAAGGHRGRGQRAAHQAEQSTELRTNLKILLF